MSGLKLFKQDLEVVNIGLESFVESIDTTGGKVQGVDWQPPAGGDPETLKALKRLNRADIAAANDKVLNIIRNGHPILIGMALAREVIPNMEDNLILHAGPPVLWEHMCGPTRGAVMGALVYEGIAKNVKEAEEIAASGQIKFAPCHEHSTVGPMAGVVSASMPVFIVWNKTHGNTAYCTMNEGLGKVLRYGAFSDEVVQRLKWMEQSLFPVLKNALEKEEGIDLKNIIAQALHMGDEVHNRNRAATSLFYRAIVSAILKTEKDSNKIKEVLDFINGNDHFFLNLSMPACKAVLDAARDIENSSVVVAMARNGTEFGVQLSGTGNAWYTGIAPIPDALFFPGFTKDDANPDIGDSAITETGGLGGFAIASSPAIVQFVGGSASDAVNFTKEMYEITIGENNVYQIPYLNFRGTPTAIDVIRVVEKNITPFIDTGVAHKDPGVGQVGAGVLKAPMEPFKNALFGLASL